MKIGFPCQRSPQRDEWKVGTTTVAHMRKVGPEAAREYLKRLALQNALNLERLVSTVIAEEPAKRMMRIGSDIWPLVDHPEFTGYDLSWSRAVLRRVGRAARAAGVRLSFHPPQFCALASDRADVVERTIETLYWHGQVARLVGAQDINIHCWGRGGVAAFRTNAEYLDAEVRSRLTVENDEFGVGSMALIDSPLGFPLVMDPHHHWINTGTWPTTTLCHWFARTWPAGRKPKMHLSYPRDSVVQYPDRLPTLLGNRTDARAHHDLLPDPFYNRHWLEVAEINGVDIMVEAKSKDVARDALFEQARALDLV